MDSNNYNGLHILSEAVIMGGISMYFFKKISDLESTIGDLKDQLKAQNNQIQYLMSLKNYPNLNLHSNGMNISQQQGTPLIIPHTRLNGNTIPQTEILKNQAYNQPINHSERINVECEGGVCRLIQKKNNGFEEASIEKKVVISKISKQIEFDNENIEACQTTKVNTFTDFSPNPVLASVTPKASVSSTSDNTDGESDLQKILNNIIEE